MSIYDRLVDLASPNGMIDPDILHYYDHFHALGVKATAELADRLAIENNNHILDLGCGVGGPARYFAQRFGCYVSGIDINEQYIEAGKKLNTLLNLNDKIELLCADFNNLYQFKGQMDYAFALHVTMNVPDRFKFYQLVYTSLKSGGYMIVSEHGAGVGEPRYPLAWALEPKNSFLYSLDYTCQILEKVGFCDINYEIMTKPYQAAYEKSLLRLETDEKFFAGLALMMDEQTVKRFENTTYNISHGYTVPFEVICKKP